VCAAALGVAAWSSKQTETTEATSYLERCGQILDTFRADSLRSIDELIERWELDVLTNLPIAPPSPDVPIEVGKSRTVLFTPDTFPAEFLEKLIPMERDAGGRPYVAYPVCVVEDGRTRARIVFTANGTEIMRVKAPENYDPFWLIRDRIDALTDGKTTRAGDDAYVKWLMAVNDPARVVSYFDLVTEEAAIVIAAARAATARAPASGGGGAMMAMGGGPVTALCFTAIGMVGPYGVTNQELHVAMAWSNSSLDSISLLTCDDLVDPDWSLVLTTNVTGTNRYVYKQSYLDDAAFFKVFDSAADSDGDGVPDYSEVVDDTDPDDPNDPPNVLGSVAYVTEHGGGGQTGVIHVVAVTSAGSWSTNYSDSIPETGAYHIVDIPADTYWIKAWRDSDGDDSVGFYEPTNETISSITVTGQITGVNLVLVDPDTDGDDMGDWWEDDYFDGLYQASSGDPDEDKLMNLYEYYAGTDPTNGFMDADSDGMSDDWEKYNGLDYLDPADAAEDPDLDGFSNLEEFLNNGNSFGTDPTDPLSHPSGGWYVATDGVDSLDNDGGSYTNPFETIEYAMDQASDGQRILLFPGTYAGSDNRDLDFGTKNLIVGGLSVASNVIIDCASQGRAFRLSSSSITNAVIRNLTVRDGFIGGSGSYGGGVYCSEAGLTVRDCVFDSCEAGWCGGGFYAVDSSGVVIEGTVFSDNTAGQYDGGGLCIDACDGPIVTRCAFLDNSAVSRGGAVAFWATVDAVLRSSLFARNSAHSGGGLYVYSQSATVSAEVAVANCTVADNTASSSAGGIYNEDLGSIVNTVVYSNTAPASPDLLTGGDVAVDYSCTPLAVSGSGNITNAPGFVKRDAASYRLAYGSACFDAGTNALWMTSALDLAGNPRIRNYSVDMGAYESCYHYVKQGNTAAASVPYDTWDSAAATIQDAVDIAAPGFGIVIVTNGVYQAEAVVVGGGAPCRLALTNAVRVLSVNGAAATVIAGVAPRGPGAIRCAYLADGALLEGFTLTNGHTRLEGVSTATDGGGALCEDGGMLEGCLVTGCAAERGGGVCGGEMLLCTIEGNSAVSGGGVHGVLSDQCSIVGNEAQSDGGGVKGGTARFCEVRGNTAVSGGGTHEAFSDRCTIVSNTATYGGGTWGGTNLSCLIAYNEAQFAGGGMKGGLGDGCTIRENSAASGGGAHLAFGERCIIVSNMAAYGGGVWGGTNRSCLLLHNEASSDGGGAYGALVENCTIVTNTASSGGGTYGCTSCNSIVYCNTPSNWLGGVAEYCCLTPIAAGDGNFTNLPGFLYPAASDYRLTQLSPCLDAGTNAAWMTDVAALNPVSRILGGSGDIGAYEKQWLKDSVLVIDDSESMTGDPLAVSKYQAGLHVDTMRTNDMVACVAFTETAWTVHQLDKIGHETAKETIKEEIDALTDTTEGTSLDEGIAAGLTQLQSYGGPDDDELVLLTDASAGSYDDIESIPPGTRVHTLILHEEWGSRHTHAWTSQRRHGLYLAFPTPVGIVGINNANVLMGEESSAPLSSTNSHEVLIDDSVKSVVFRSYWDYGNTALTMCLETPDEQSITTNDLPSNVVCHVYDGCVMYQVVDPDAGCWEMKITGGAEGEVHSACAYCDSYIGADLYVDRLVCTTGQQVRIVVRTSPQATNATVSLTNEWYSNGTTLDLHDDGLHGDGAAHDGVYGSTNYVTGTDWTSWRVNATVTGVTDASNTFRRVAECSFYVKNLFEFDGAPAGLSASDGTKPDAVDLTWSPVVGADYYDVYRSTSDSIIDARLIHVADETQYSDTNVFTNVTYRYWVRAHEGSHTDSAFSAADTGYAAP